MSAAAAPYRRTRPFWKDAWLPVLGGLLVATLSTGLARAYWTAPGTGGGSGQVATLAAPTLSGSPGAGTATLTWTAITPPGLGSVTYYAQRNGGNAGGDCPTQAAPTSVLTCTDTGLSKGTYNYTVTAVWQSWTATSSPATQVTLASGALDHFVLAAATTTPTAGAADNLTITATDSGGNTVTAYTGSHNLTFTGAGTIGTYIPTVTNSTGTATDFGTATAITFASGVATVSGSNNGVMRLYKVETANIIVGDGSGHSNGAGFSVTVSAAAANKLAFTRSPGNTVAGVAFAAQPQVTVQDQYGNTVTGDASTATLTIKSGTPTSGGPGSLTGCLESESSGVITFSGCTITTVGTGYQLHATDGSLTAADSTAFNITPAAANRLAFNQSPGDTVAGVALAPQPQVTVQDQYGNTVTTDSSNVTIAVTGGTATVTGCANTKAAIGGVATFSGCTITKAGTYTLTATDGLLTSAESGSFTISAAAANRLAFTAQPTNATGGATISSVAVTVQDIHGNTVTSSNASITVAIGTNPGGGTLSGTKTVNAVNGVATFSNLSIDHVGTGYTLTAASSPLTGATSNSFNITVGVASKLAFTAQPGGGASSTAWANQPTVTVQDAGGNTVTTAVNSITLVITTPGGANLTCTTNPKNAVAGVDAFAGCRIDKAGTYTLTATATGLTSAGSNSFNITVGVASKLAFTTQPGGGASSTAWATQPTVTVQDAGGNTVTTAVNSITLAITTPGGATLTCTANPRAAVAGVDTFAGCRIDKAGTYTLTATATGLTSAVSNSFTITATVAFSSGPTLASNGYLPTHVNGSGFSGSVTISWSYAWGGYIYSTTTAADGSGNFTWNNYENCIDGYDVYQTTDQTVTVNATDGTHTATGTGTLLCSLRPRYP